MASQSLTVGIYARLSQDRDGEATSTDRQVADCRQLAEARGWTVGGVYVDRGISGYSGAVRPEFDRMLGDVDAGKLGGVVAWKLDRLSRNRADWHRIASRVDAGLTLAAVHDPVDTSTPLGSVVVDLLASMARAESANSSTRIRRATEERARQGKPHPAGGRVFGYTDTYELVPEEAAAARWAAGQLLAGRSLRSVAADLNAQGVRTARGNPWRGETLKRTLTAPTLAAIRIHHGTEYPGDWPAVLDRATWEQLGAYLDTRTRSIRAPGHRTTLLPGLARCGLCGTAMQSQRKPDGTARYRCVRQIGGCGRVGILGDGLDGFVRDAVLHVLDGDGLASTVRTLAGEGDAAEVVAELQAAERRLEQLATDHYVDGLLGRAEYLAARDAGARKVADLRAQLRASADTSALAELVGVDLAGWWDGADLEQRRAVCDAVLEAVRVHPPRRGGRGWDPERVELRWRV